MAEPPPLTEQERADLVAYLDGELDGKTAQALEAIHRAEVVIGYDGYFAGLDDLVAGKECHALPLTRETRGLVGRAELDLLPRHAGLVNLGRGAVIDNDALADKLRAGELSGAVLDVFPAEPLPAAPAVDGDRHRRTRTPEAAAGGPLGPRGGSPRYVTASGASRRSRT